MEYLLALFGVLICGFHGAGLFISWRAGNRYAFKAPPPKY